MKLSDNITFDVLSLGAGIQSTTLYLMSALGHLPPIDFAIFADTGWESESTYRHIEFLKSNYNIPIETVSAGNIFNDTLSSFTDSNPYFLDSSSRWISLPAWTLSSGKIGKLKRQCTAEYKIRPIRKLIHSRLKRGQFFPGSIRLWFGFSIDEFLRSFYSDVNYIQNYFPLIEMNLSRSDCIRFLEANLDKIPIRSACLGCPFRRDLEWKNCLVIEKEFNSIIKIDNTIRKHSLMFSELFLHKSATPMSDLPFLNQISDSKQLNAFDSCSWCEIS